MEITVTKKSMLPIMPLAESYSSHKKHATKLLQIIETKAAASVLDCYVPLATLTWC